MNAEANLIKEDNINRAIWKINFNIWLLLGISLGFWFIFVHGIPYFFKGIGPCFIIHLLNASLITIICMINFLHTPSHGPIYRKMHIWLGRLSFIFGISSTIIGLVTAWYERFEGVAFFPIAVSIGGTLQVIAQCLAIYYIRKKNVTKHLFWNHIVFFGGCLTPAIIRFEYLIQTEIPYWNLYSWAIILAVGLLSFRAFVYKTWY